MKKVLIQTVVLAAALTASNAVLADSLGGLLSGHGTQELKSIFQFAALFFSFIGFLIAGICVIGMGMIKLAPNNPATQKFEQAGMGGLLIGTMVGSVLGALTTVIYMFIGTAAGEGADTSVFDKLKAGSVYQIDHHEYAQADLSFIAVKHSNV